MRTPTTTVNSPTSGPHPKTWRSADPTAATSHGTTAGTSTPDPANTRDKPASTKPGLTQFDDHHAELARMLLDSIDALTARIDTLTTRIDELLNTMPQASAPDTDSGTPGTGTGLL